VAVSQLAGYCSASRPETKAGTGEHRDTARPPLHQPSQKSSFGWMIPVIGFGGIGAAAITAVFPSTAMWTSGLVCAGRYHLHYRRSEISIGNDHSYGSSFRCVSDAGSYNVNQLAIIGLQVLPLVLLVCAIAALKRRRRRSLSELNGAYAYKSSSGNSQTWTITPCGPGSVEIASEGGRTAAFTGKAKLNGRHWKMVAWQPDAVADNDGCSGSGTTTFLWSATKLRGFVGHAPMTGCLINPRTTFRRRDIA
jgi:hypothetical protein